MTGQIQKTGFQSDSLEPADSMHSKKRLTYILHGIAVGGVEVALLSAIPSLAAKYQLRIIVLGDIDPKMIQGLTEEEKTVFEKFSYPLYLYPLVLPKIIRYVLRSKPDILIASLWRAALVALLVRSIRKSGKFYSFVHNTNFPHFLAHFFIKRASQRADAVLTDSYATSEFVQRDFRPAGEVKIVSFLTRRTPELSAIRPPAASEVVTFMYLGRISKTKNLSAAIQAMAVLQSKGIKVSFDIYGRDDDGSVASLVELIRNLGLQEHVHFKGEVSSDQKWNLFNQYHFYIQLSLSEGMAMSVTEAMQNGLVCIVSPVGEIVHYTEDMQSAIIIDIFNEGWQHSLDKVALAIADAELYKRLSSNSHRRFSQKKLYKESLLEQITS